MNVQVQKNYGQLKVTKFMNKQVRPLHTVYVKVFAKKKNGQIAFWKDGYTDLRGKFDYATKSEGSLSDIEKYSILIVSKNSGSQIKEIGPPSKLGKLMK